MKSKLISHCFEFLSLNLFLRSLRSLLMAELEKEEKEKDWYYAQLQNLTKRIDSLPLTENVSQTRLTFSHSSARSAATSPARTSCCSSLCRPT